jgi:trehalose synthase-fused probable maltokinase
MTPDELAAQRWFRSKQRPIASVTEADRAPLGDAALVVLEVAFADDGPPERYLVPRIGDREPHDGEGAWASLVRAIGDEEELRGAHGHFTCSRTDAFAPLTPANRTERRLNVEQSNTSVVVGDRLILKLYRLLEPGENPDLEIGAFLTDVGFPDTPAVAGAITYRPDDGEASAAAMLQELVHTTGDAWAAMLAVLATDPVEGVGLAARIGEVTAAMHAALASCPDHPAFPARPASVGETAGWRASAERQLAQAIGALSGTDHDRLVELAPAVRERFADTFGSASGQAAVSRIHGDYHLGQLLARPDGGFSVIDFEGEPARPLAERRLPGSPLRDVAGLLRSLDYAARTAQRATPGFDADGWLSEARSAFIGGYGAIGPSEVLLVEAFELEKACYEVRYEASNRPGWLWLPLAAVERLAQ